jgi:Tfp pilus assembly protein PilP
MRTLRTLGLAALVLLVGADALSAQSRARRGEPADTTTPLPEVTLRLEREVFLYVSDARRDPFVPLRMDEALGPRFENLVLQGIMHSPAAGQSMAVLADPKTKQSYRVRRGEQVGNARVLNISQTQVLFAVDVFGIVRQETLELKKDPKGATR